MNSLSGMKDGSPASTCSSSPKLDWMIKRGMVGLFLKTCPGFSSVHLSTTSVSFFCLVGLFYFTFALVWIDFVWIHFWCSVFEVLCYNTLVCMIWFFFYMWRRWIVFLEVYFCAYAHSRGMTLFGPHCPDMLHCFHSCCTLWFTCCRFHFLVVRLFGTFCYIFIKLNQSLYFTALTTLMLCFLP